jgi:predicted transposase/invertase (TIGR01784 family)
MILVNMENNVIDNSSKDKHKDSGVANPHDSYLNYVLSNKENIKDLLKNALSEELYSKINLESIEVCQDKLVDKHLSSVYSDLLLSVDYDGSSRYVYILIEHKSYKNKWAVVQLLKYMIRIWEKEVIADVNELTPIIPIFFLHAGASSSKYMKLSDLFPQTKELQRFIPQFDKIIYDLNSIADHEIKGNLLFVISMRIMKNILTDVIGVLNENINALDEEVDDLELLRAFLESSLTYISSFKKDEKSENELMKTMDNLQKIPGKEVFMSILSKYMEKGMEKGIIQGEARGIAKAVIANLQKLHKVIIPDQMKQQILAQQDIEVLNEWLDLTLSVTDFESFREKTGL